MHMVLMAISIPVLCYGIYEENRNKPSSYSFWLNMILTGPLIGAAISILLAISLPFRIISTLISPVVDCCKRDKSPDSQQSLAQTQSFYSKRAKSQQSREINGDNERDDAATIESLSL